MNIDVIIPVYNSRNTLFKTLSSVALQSISDKVVLHIVDDCSDDIYEDIISQFNKELKIMYYKLNKNSGP